MYKLVVLICSLAILASIMNMDWHLWGMVTFVPAMLAINWAGAMVTLWAWAGDS